MLSVEVALKQPMNHELLQMHLSKNKQTQKIERPFKTVVLTSLREGQNSSRPLVTICTHLE